MQQEPRLSVQVGWASLQGRRADNQDFVGIAEPGSRELASRGFMAAVADGCGGCKGGRTAAELCVRSFMEAYYSLPETLGIQQLAARALGAINGWIHALGQRDPDHANMATTFSALILRGREAHLVHVGDTRIYRLRGDRLDPLTEDHTLKGAGRDHILSRAVGLEGAVPADYSVHAVEGHDRYLLCTDGLSAALKHAELRERLRQRQEPGACAKALADAAAACNDHDNITALVVDVLALPLPGAGFLRETIALLPIGELPRVGASVDGYDLVAQLSSGRYSTLFLATDRHSGSRVVLKFPHPRVASEREYYLAFTREAWIGLRIKSPWVAEIIEQAPGRQTRLYSVMPYYRGETLEQRIAGRQVFSLAEGIEIALKLCRAVHTLHRRGVIHRDIKCDNILCLEDGGLKLLDLGIALLPAWDDDRHGPVPGTPSYMAPELFRGERGSVASDVFAVGVTLFRLFANGTYPYGEIEPFMHPHFGRPKRLATLRPDLPAWLDFVLQQALAVEVDKRYADTIELAFDLENGLAKGGQRTPERPSIYRRDPVGFWRTVSLILLLMLLYCAVGSRFNGTPQAEGFRPSAFPTSNTTPDSRAARRDR